MAVVESVLDLVGGTPLVRLRRLGGGLLPRIYAKIESQNPGGSVKDRAAVAMIRAAEEAGLLQPGGTIVEGTSGNTGVGLSFAAAALGYRSVIFVPSSTSDDKVRLLRAYGATVNLVGDFVPRDDPRHLANVAQAYVDATPGAWLARQFENEANPGAHYVSTGPEIWEDTQGRITHLVATVGTGGTISGTGRFLKDVSKGAVTVVGADPEHSTYGGGRGELKYVEGSGHALHPDSAEDIWPSTFEHSVVDAFIRIPDAQSIHAARRAAREEGILAGGTAGTALAAALKLAVGLNESHTIVVIFPDTGRNYLSTYFSDEWLTGLGFALDDTQELPLAPAQQPSAHPLETHHSSAHDAGEREGVHLLPVGVTTAKARLALTERGLNENEPVFLTLDRGTTFGTVHPKEVSGVVTLSALRAVQGNEPALRVAQPFVTRGLAQQAVQLRAADPGSNNSAVFTAILHDGRIVAAHTSAGNE